MKKTIISLGKSTLLLSLFFLIFFCSDSYAFDWQELSGEHFIVYFLENKNFAQDTLDKAEVYYRNIAMELGYPRYSDFWTWDNRVKIYIYPDRKTYLQLTGEPAWSAGVASYDRKEIVSFAWSDNFLEFLLPHEITHLMFRDFVGFKGEVPLWLDEGVAQWAEVVIGAAIDSLPSVFHHAP